MKKITIPTVKFQEMVAKSAKGASQNKLLPITSLLAIELKNNVLTLTTTDTSNTLKIIADKIEGDDLYAVVPVEVFSKLIAKMTAEKITLDLKDNSIEVKGDGTYNIALAMDEDGVVKFPEYQFKKKGNPETIHLTSVKNILAINKAAVAKTIDTPCLGGYYIGDMVVTTDEDVICFNDMKLSENGDILVSPDMMELLALNSQEKIDFYRSGDSFLFETPDVVLHGVEHDGKELFPINEIKGYLTENFSSVCKVPKLLLQNVIERLALFIEPYDKNGAYLTFTKEGIQVTSKRKSSVELITYQESRDFAPFVCCVDIPMLREQINATPGENLEIWYGHESAIKITSDKITQVIALLEDENIGTNSGAEE